MRSAPGERVNVFVIESEIAGKLAELRGFGNSAERIFGSDFREFECGLHHAVEAFAREVTGIGAGSALPEEHAHADGFRAGFFQRLDLAEANQRGEFVAFADDAFGGGGAAGHGTARRCPAARLSEVGCEFRFSCVSSSV